MEKIKFYDDGKYEKYCEVNGVKEGKAVYFWGQNTNLTEKDDDYGKIKEIFCYEKGIKQGKGITYFDKAKTSKIKEEFFYVDNVKEGESFLLYPDKLEKRNYVEGKISGKILVYKINGKAEARDSDDNSVKEKFRTLKEILGMDMEKQEESKELEEWEYEELKKEAEKRFNELVYSSENFEREERESRNIVSGLFIEKYYLRNKERK